MQPEQIQYVVNELKRGVPEATVSQTLVDNGYPQEQVVQLLMAAKEQMQPAPAPEAAPVAPAPQTEAAPAAAVEQQAPPAAPAPGAATMAPPAAAPAPGATVGAPPAAAVGDISQHKTIAILGYIIPFIFFIPLLSDESKNHPYARFHASQQLTLLVSWLVFWFGFSILSFFLGIITLGFSMIITAFLFPIASIVFLVVAIMGAVSASKGEMKPLPIVGGFKILH